MKKDLEPKKLALSKQTLRLLNTNDLAKVKGAAPIPTGDGFAACNTLLNCRRPSDFC